MSESTDKAPKAEAPKKDPFAALKARAEALEAKQVIEMPADEGRKTSGMLRVDH